MMEIICQTLKSEVISTLADSVHTVREKATVGAVGIGVGRIFPICVSKEFCWFVCCPSIVLDFLLGFFRIGFPCLNFLNDGRTLKELIFSSQLVLPATHSCKIAHIHHSIVLMMMPKLLKMPVMTILLKEMPLLMMIPVVMFLKVI